MFSIGEKRFAYSSVEDHDEENEPKVGGPQLYSRRPRSIIAPLSLVLLALLLVSSTTSSWFLFLNFRQIRNHNTQQSVLTQASLACQQAPVRREWRKLTVPEKHDYVRAVRCLATKPSRLGLSGSLYDDFPWVHKQTASSTHKSAPFLPWHRYYLSLYETALKQECSFRGSLPYWDWSLDSSDFRSAPVWDEGSGLGGDGTGSASVGDGRCVTAGPFSDIEMSFYDGDVQPHCLSRGFPSDAELKELGELVRPEAIKTLMNEEHYDGFARDLERRAHKFLSHSVRGDLSRFTGPNDPVFFLHHVNIDKLWWQWQQTRPRERLSAYEGRARNDTDVAALLTDALDMGGLSRNAQVIDVMDTRGGQFCYRY